MTNTVEVCWKGLEDLRETLGGFLQRFCRDPNEVDDVVQETIVRAARYRAHLAEPERLRPWAIRIAVNVLKDRRRLAQRIVSLESEEGLFDAREAPCPVEQEPETSYRLGAWVLDREAALARLERAMSSLRDDDRRVLGSFYGGEGTCRHTARECAIPAHLVKVRLFRARQRLSRAVRRGLSLDGLHPGVGLA